MALQSFLGICSSFVSFRSFPR